MITRIRDDQVIHDPTIRIGKQRITRLPLPHTINVARHEFFQSLGCITPPKLDLPHMRDIKQSRFLPALGVFLDDPGILHWHTPASEIHHLRTEFNI